MKETLAAEAFGKGYREATRRPGEPRFEQNEDGTRGSRLGMKTLSDQVAGEDEEEREGSSLSFECPACGATTPVRLPDGFSLEDGEDDEEEAEGRQGHMRVKCGACDEAYRLEAPAGQHFSRRASEAAAAFARSYRRVRQVRESALRHGHLGTHL